VARLTMEQVQEQKKGILETKKILEGRNGEYMFDNYLDLIETIESLQQELHQLQNTRQSWEQIEAGGRNILEENERLRAEAVAMRTILQDMVDVAQTCGSAYLYRRDIDKVVKVLSSDAGKELLEEMARLKEQSTCGCGICLAHNNNVCPKLKAGGTT
jgi:regulator of replication initiation timing